MIFYSGEEPSTLGGRFSKSSMERERILQRRKEHMLLTARRKYFEKHPNQSESTGADISTVNSEDIASRLVGSTHNWIINYLEWEMKYRTLRLWRLARLLKSWGCPFVMVKLNRGVDESGRDKLSNFFRYLSVWMIGWRAIRVAKSHLLLQ